MIRIGALALALLGVAVTDTPARLRFVQPVRAFVLAGPRGVTFAAQVFIPRHPDNRSITIAWDGEGCNGLAARTLDGENEAAVFPLKPLAVEATPGICGLVAVLRGAGGKELARVDMAVDVRGSDGGHEGPARKEHADDEHERDE